MVQPRGSWYCRYLIDNLVLGMTRGILKADTVYKAHIKTLCGVVSRCMYSAGAKKVANNEMSDVAKRGKNRRLGSSPNLRYALAHPTQV